MRKQGAGGGEKGGEEKVAEGGEEGGAESSSEDFRKLRLVALRWYVLLRLVEPVSSLGPTLAKLRALSNASKAGGTTAEANGGGKDARTANEQDEEDIAISAYRYFHSDNYARYLDLTTRYFGLAKSTSQLSKPFDIIVACLLRRSKMVQI